MTMLEAPAYADLDVVEAEVVDIVDDAVLDARHVVEALVVDSLAIDADVVEVVEVVAAPLVDVEPGRAEPDGGTDAEPRRHLRVAPDLVGRRRRVRIAAAGAAVAISATLFAVVGFNVELAQHQIQLQHLQEQLQSEQQHYYDLRTEVAEGSAPDNIVSEAERLGLVAATNSYLPVAIPQPPEDTAGQNGLAQIQNNESGVLGNLK